MQDFGADSVQSQYVMQYLIAGHLWAAFHIHRGYDGQLSGTIQQRTDHAYKILKTLLASPSAEPAGPLPSEPVVTKTTRAGPSKSRNAPRSRKPPVTPKVRKGWYLPAMFHVLALTPTRPVTEPVSEVPKPTRLSLEPSIRPAIPYDRQQRLIDVLCSYVSSGPDF